VSSIAYLKRLRWTRMSSDLLWAGAISARIAWTVIVILMLVAERPAEAQPGRRTQGER
jgi:hypothetical protein